MHHFRALFLPLLLLHASQSASLVLSNTPTSNALYQGTPQTIQPGNLTPPSNRSTDRLTITRGTYHDIGSNLTIYITLGDTAVPAQSLHELLRLATQQVHHRAALFGSAAPVPHRKHERNLTQTVGAGGRLVYFVDPSPAFVPGRPGLEWGEFEAVTSWLYEHLSVVSTGREWSFVLFRRIGAATGQEVNLAFGAVKSLNGTMIAGAA